MQIRLQTALITGSSRGLGRQIAVKLATEGVRKIAIHSRTGLSAAEMTLSLIETRAPPAFLCKAMWLM
jgi:3-oxoacyl-[acyl-carrier protein] reductase